jgi:preprotein translocase subunit SecG
MGGFLFVVPVLLITGVLNLADLLGFNLIGQSTLLLFFCMAAYSALGAVDDWQGIRGLRGKGEGMSARMKSSFQFIFAVIIASVLYFGPPELNYVGVPGIPNFVEIGWLFLPIAVFVIVGFSNAVNLTDGLDSLAGSLSSVAFASYGIIAFLQRQTYLAAFCFTIVGALLAFLWFNAHPAELFMGDTGSLALRLAGPPQDTKVVACVMQIAHAAKAKGGWVPAASSAAAAACRPQPAHSAAAPPSWWPTGPADRVVLCCPACDRPACSHCHGGQQAPSGEEPSGGGHVGG